MNGYSLRVHRSQPQVQIVVMRSDRAYCYLPRDDQRSVRTRAQAHTVEFSFRLDEPEIFFRNVVRVNVDRAPDVMRAPGLGSRALSHLSSRSSLLHLVVPSCQSRLQVAGPVRKSSRFTTKARLLLGYVPNVQIVQYVQVVQRIPFGSDGLNILNGLNRGTRPSLCPLQGVVQSMTVISSIGNCVVTSGPFSVTTIISSNLTPH